MVRNFRFEQPGAIALSAVPDSPEAVDWLYEQGIRAVVSLHPISPEVEARLREKGIAWKPFLVGDWADGVPRGIDEAFAFLRRHAAEEPAALVHCQGGGGRAGTFYAAYLVDSGIPVAEAMTRVPGVERDAQKAFLHGFAAGREKTR